MTAMDEFDPENTGPDQLIITEINKRFKKNIQMTDQMKKDPTFFF